MSLPSVGANGLWVNGELSREASWSVDHEQALKHPFPVLVEPERLKIHSGKSGRPTKPTGKPTKDVAGAGGLNLERFALGAKKAASDTDKVVATEANEEHDENVPPQEEPSPPPAKSATERAAKAAKPAKAAKTEPPARQGRRGASTSQIYEY